MEGGEVIWAARNVVVERRSKMDLSELFQQRPDILQALIEAQQAKGNPVMSDSMTGLDRLYARAPLLQQAHQQKPDPNKFASQMGTMWRLRNNDPDIWKTIEYLKKVNPDLLMNERTLSPWVSKRMM